MGNEKSTLTEKQYQAHIAQSDDDFENIPRLTSIHDCPIGGNERRLNKRTKHDM